jgi:hypothetical protein
VLLKRFFPGLESMKERKRFAVFHACTIFIAFIMGAIIRILINWNINFSSPLISANLGANMSLNPFTDVWVWLLWSLFAWNVIGSIRFSNDASDRSGFLASRLTFFLCMLFFPLIYLHNLWFVFSKKRINNGGSL